MITPEQDAARNDSKLRTVNVWFRRCMHVGSLGLFVSLLFLTATLGYNARLADLRRGDQERLDQLDLDQRHLRAALAEADRDQELARAPRRLRPQSSCATKSTGFSSLSNVGRLDCRGSRSSLSPRGAIPRLRSRSLPGQRWMPIQRPFCWCYPRII